MIRNRHNNNFNSQEFSAERGMDDSYDNILAADYTQDNDFSDQSLGLDQDYSVTSDDSHRSDSSGFEQTEGEYTAAKLIESLDMNFPKDPQTVEFLKQNAHQLVELDPARFFPKEHKRDMMKLAGMPLSEAKLQLKPYNTINDIASELSDNNPEAPLQMSGSGFTADTGTDDQESNNESILFPSSSPASVSDSINSDTAATPATQSESTDSDTNLESSSTEITDSKAQPYLDDLFYNHASGSSGEPIVNNSSITTTEISPGFVEHVNNDTKKSKLYYNNYECPLIDTDSELFKDLIKLTPDNRNIYSINRTVADIICSHINKTYNTQISTIDFIDKYYGFFHDATIAHPNQENNRRLAFYKTFIHFVDLTNRGLPAPKKNKFELAAELNPGAEIYSTKSGLIVIKSDSQLSIQKEVLPYAGHTQLKQDHYANHSQLNQDHAVVLSLLLYLDKLKSQGKGTNNANQIRIYSEQVDSYLKANGSSLAKVYKDCQVYSIGKSAEDKEMTYFYVLIEVFNRSKKAKNSSDSPLSSIEVKLTDSGLIQTELTASGEIIVKIPPSDNNSSPIILSGDHAQAWTLYQKLSKSNAKSGNTSENYKALDAAFNNHLNKLGIRRDIFENRLHSHKKEFNDEYSHAIACYDYLKTYPDATETDGYKKKSDYLNNFLNKNGISLSDFTKMYENIEISNSLDLDDAFLTERATLRLLSELPSEAPELRPIYTPSDRITSEIDTISNMTTYFFKPKLVISQSRSKVLEEVREFDRKLELLNKTDLSHSGSMEVVTMMHETFTENMSYHSNIHLKYIMKDFSINNIMNAIKAHFEAGNTTITREEINTLFRKEAERILPDKFTEEGIMRSSTEYGSQLDSRANRKVTPETQRLASISPSSSREELELLFSNNPIDGNSRDNQLLGQNGIPIIAQNSLRDSDYITNTYNEFYSLYLSDTPLDLMQRDPEFYQKIAHLDLESQKQAMALHHTAKHEEQYYKLYCEFYEKRIATTEKASLNERIIHGSDDDIRSICSEMIENRDKNRYTEKEYIDFIRFNASVMQESLIREREVYKDIEAQVMGDDRFYNIDASVLTFLLRAESFFLGTDNYNRIKDIDRAATEANLITGNMIGNFIKDNFVDISLIVGSCLATVLLIPFIIK